MVYITVKNINPNKLIDEFVSNKIQILACEHNLSHVLYIAEETNITFDKNVDMDLVQKIIDAHDPTPSPPQPIVEDFNLEIDYRVTMLEMIGGI